MHPEAQRKAQVVGSDRFPTLADRSFPYALLLLLSNDQEELISWLCSLLDGPGMNLAQSSLCITCAMSLAVFDIEKYVDGFGNVVEPSIRYSDGAVR